MSGLPHGIRRRPLANVYNSRSELPAGVAHGARCPELTRETDDTEVECLALADLVIISIYSGVSKSARRHEDELAVVVAGLGSATARLVGLHAR